MAIYKLSEQKIAEFTHDNHLHLTERRNHFFSAVASRAFFFLLLLSDIGWLAYTTVRLTLLLPLVFCTAGRMRPLREALGTLTLALKRGAVACVALLVALFSPALGIMFACTYFIMYDQDGVEEVVPSVLQAQFKEFMQKS